jgi:GNAT superfamily N-acetyltransferase
MYSRWFTTPDPAYGALVARLYGTAVGQALDRAYRDQLARRDLWGHRLNWTGLLVYDAAGSVQAHAVVQEIQDRPLVYVGFVESVDDPAVASLLLAAIRQHLAACCPGRPVYLPVNLSIWHSYRFRTAAEESLPFDAPTQPYYRRLFADFFPEEEWYASYRIPLDASLPDRCPAAGYTLRAPTLSTMLQDLHTIYDLSARIFESVHSVPSFAEFQAIHRPAAGTGDPRYVLIAEQAGVPVGFIYALKQAGALYVKTLAVLPAHQRHGVGRLLYETMGRQARVAGCRTVYGLTMRHDRLITRLLPRGAEKVAEYVLYKEA